MCVRARTIMLRTHLAEVLNVLHGRAGRRVSYVDGYACLHVAMCVRVRTHTVFI
jgi:hypothetical protein